MTKEQINVVIEKATDILMIKTVTIGRKWNLNHFNGLYNQVLKECSLDDDSVFVNSEGRIISHPVYKLCQIALRHHMIWQGHKLKSTCPWTFQLFK